jgi:hypothetical protein
VAFSEAHRKYLQNMLELVVRLQDGGKKIREEIEAELAKGGTALSISFMPDLVLTKLPEVEAVPAGLYASQSAWMIVEVVGQDPETGMVTMEVPNEDTDDKRVESISAALFKQLFRQLPPQIFGRQAG